VRRTAGLQNSPYDGAGQVDAGQHGVVAILPDGRLERAERVSKLSCIAVRVVSQEIRDVTAEQCGQAVPEQQRGVLGVDPLCAPIATDTARADADADAGPQPRAIRSKQEEVRGFTRLRVTACRPENIGSVSQALSSRLALSLVNGLRVSRRRSLPSAAISHTPLSPAEGSRSKTIVLPSGDHAG